MQPTSADLLAQMRGVQHLRHLAGDELTAILFAGEIRTRSHGELLFAEGEPCAGLFVLLEGQVELRKHSQDGQLSIVSVIDPVIMFNEVAALDAGDNPVTAAAHGDVICWRIDAAGLQRIILRHPPLALGLLRVLAARNRFLTARYEDLSFRPVLGRAALLLLRLSEDGCAAIDRRKYTNSRMAAMISTVPEAFSRALPRASPGWRAVVHRAHHRRHRPRPPPLLRRLTPTKRSPPLNKSQCILLAFVLRFISSYHTRRMPMQAIRDRFNFLFSSTRGLILLAIACIALVTAFFGFLSGPMEEFGVRGFMIRTFGISLNPAEREGRIIMLYHSIAMAIVAIETYMITSLVKMRREQQVMINARSRSASC